MNQKIEVTSMGEICNLTNVQLNFIFISFAIKISSSLYHLEALLVE